MFFSKCLAGSDLLFLSVRSIHRIAALLTVCPIQFWQNDRWIVNGFLSSNNHRNVIRLSLLLSKLSIMERKNLLGNPVAIYLLTIRLISMPKLEVIFLALSNSTRFVFHWNFWCPMYGELLHFMVHLSCNFAVILNNLRVKDFFLDQFVRSVLYFAGTSWMHCKVHQFHCFFFWHRYHPHNSSRKYILKVPLYLLSSCKHKYPKEQQISVIPLDSHQFG